jgi:hypothetical protein
MDGEGVPASSWRPEEVWKTTRTTVEHFDKITVDILRIFLTVTGVLSTIAATILTRPETTNKTNLMFMLGTAMIVLVFLFWVVDAHYRNYLRVSAAIARRLERRMQFPDVREAISLELQAFCAWYDDRGEESRGRRWPLKYSMRKTSAPYHLVYPVAGAGVIFLIVIVNVNAGVLPKDLYYLIWTIILAVVIGALWCVMTRIKTEVVQYIRLRYDLAK